MSTAYPIKYSFSGSDCRVYAYYNKNEVILLDNLTTISISVHEAKSPVRRLGHMAPVGYTRGIRTIAGSIVFTVTSNEHPLKRIKDLESSNKVYYSKDSFNSEASAVRMHPLNLLLLYQTELPTDEGSKLTLFDVEFLNEGLVTSINDLVSEVVVQFVALDISAIEPLRSLNKKKKIKSTPSNSVDGNSVSG